jgi:hypothetical protein
MFYHSFSAFFSSTEEDKNEKVNVSSTETLNQKPKTFQNVSKTFSHLGSAHNCASHCRFKQQQQKPV